MRTQADLDGAFALLERQLDAHLAETAAPVGLQAPTPLRRGARPHSASAHRRVPAIAAAAACVLALAGGIGYLGTRAGSPQQPGASASLKNLPLRSLSFIVRPSAGMTVASVFSSGDQEQGVDLLDRTHHLTLDVYATGADVGQSVPVLRGLDSGGPVPGLQRVSVNGRPGYFGPLDNRAKPSAGEPEFDGLVWLYAPHSWAALGGQGTYPTETELLRVARAVAFRAAEPIRVPVHLSAAPHGLTLDNLTSTYHQLADNPPFKPANHDWYAQIVYTSAGTGNGVEISADPYRSARDLRLRAGTPITVGGRRAYWDAKDHAVTVDFGNDIGVSVQEYQNDASKPLTMSRAALTAVARRVTLTGHPADPARWFNARTALP